VTRSRALNAATAVLLALAPAASCLAQGISFSWNAELTTSGSMIDRGGDAELSSRDLLDLGLGLRREAVKGTFAFELEGGLEYAPQDIASGAPRSEAFMIYPALVEASWESAPGLAADPMIRVGAGRVEASEPTGLFLFDPEAAHPAQLMDGLGLEFRRGKLYASLSAGYLGLLDKRLNRIRLSGVDEADLLDADRYWAPPRVLAILTVQAERLAFAQDAAFLCVWQKDFREDSEERLDSWYFGATARGPALPGLRHDEAVVVSIALPQGESSYAGMLARAKVAYDLPWGPFGEAWLGALWAGGFGGSFPSLAGPSESLAYDLTPEDLVKAELGADASLGVFPRGGRLDASLALRALFVPSGSVAQGYSFETAETYLGTELEAGLDYAPIFGLGIKMRAGILATPEAVHPCARLEGRITL